MKKFLEWTSLGAGLLTLSSCQCTDKKAEKIPVLQPRPNILVFIADDSSYPYASAYGCPFINTPGFDRVAEEGILFNNAFTPNSKSAPSRACLLTGQYSWQLESAGNHCTNWPEGKFPTFMETLRENGYQAAFAGKGWAPGNPGKVNGKRRELTGKGYHKIKCTPPTECMGNCDYAENFKAFMQEKEEGKPWVFWCGTIEPHRPYAYGSGVKLGGKNPDEIKEVPGYLPNNNTIRTDFTDYAFEIEYQDGHLVEILDYLESVGELDNTLIIVTADNGMPFPRCKGNQYHNATHLPMAMMWKNGITAPGRTENEYVSFVDIAPTVLSVAGVTESEMHPEGREMTDIFQNKKNKDRSWLLLGQERHDCGRPNNQSYPIRSIMDGEFLYIHNLKPELWPVCNPETGYLNTDASPSKTEILNFRRKGIDESLWQLSFGKRPEEELYNIIDDPDCMINLAENPKYQELKEKLSKRLLGELTRTQDPRLGDNPDVFDNYIYDRDFFWNFYERYMAGEFDNTHTNWCEPSDYEPEPLD